MLKRIAIASALLLLAGVGFVVGQTSGLPDPTGGLSGVESSWRNSLFHIGMLRITRDSSITATPSGTINNSYQLIYGLNRITTIATGGDSVKTPACIGGKDIIIINAHASNALNIFPNTSSETINALGAGSAYSLAAGKSSEWYCAVDGAWYVKLSAEADPLQVGRGILAANDNRKALRHAS